MQARDTRFGDKSTSRVVSRAKSHNRSSVWTHTCEHTSMLCKVISAVEGDRNFHASQHTIVHRVDFDIRPYRETTMAGLVMLGVQKCPALFSFNSLSPVHAHWSTISIYMYHEPPMANLLLLWCLNIRLLRLDVILNLKLAPTLMSTAWHLAKMRRVLEARLERESACMGCWTNCDLTGCFGATLNLVRQFHDKICNCMHSQLILSVWCFRIRTSFKKRSLSNTVRLHVISCELCAIIWMEASI